MNNEIIPSSNSILQENKLQEGFASAFQLVDDIVLKNYITKLPELPIIPLDDAILKNSISQIRLFKITEMVYEKDESATYKFASVFNTVAAANSAIFTIIDSDGAKTDFYMGIRSSENNSPQTSYSTLVNAMKGQFPGAKTENLKAKSIQQLLDSIATGSISSVSCVANNKNKDFVANDEYLQGLEKFALAMQGTKYTAIILANSTSQEQLNLVRQGYENIFTQLSTYANTVVSYGTNSSVNQSQTETIGENMGLSKSDSTGKTITHGTTENQGDTVTESKQTIGSKIGSTIGATLSIAGVLIGSMLGDPATMMIGSAVGGLVGTSISTATNKTISKTHGGKSTSYSEASTTTNTVTVNSGTSHSFASTLGLASGESKNIQLTVQNKPVISMLERIDKQLQRLSDFESIGMWECAAYFLSDDSSVSKVAAATYKALMSGENSGLEVSAINTWNEPLEPSSKDTSQNAMLAKYIRNFIHPVFSYTINGSSIPVTPIHLVSGNELAIHMGLPRHSVWGLPVIEHTDFGKEIVRYNSRESSDEIQLGKIFSMGRAIDSSKVKLDVDSLAMHTFIVGATGSGKSNTIYTLLDKLTATRQGALTYMVIEPAKGEYKNIFGQNSGVSVFGTNPAYTKLLRINPFKFPKGVHVLEHIDRLVEIFNVCWPMYAAMPAVLKDAVLAAYNVCGWDFEHSNNTISDDLYPTFQDLLSELVRVINESAYSDEVKSNYIGSLTTRVKSLSNGLNGQIFSSNEIDNNVLFDSNVIVDLSRIGSQETKALIMGVLVMRLSEHRMSNKQISNSKLRHITVLEEAHNILGAVPDDTGTEGTNISGKSVKMLSNAIAEMRTYGEGFIIADQSPGAVDISAIRNTNTKIVMRLSEENDRRTSGKAAALKDNQIDEIARLPRGVAVVYQNDWAEPVLCQIDKFSGKEAPFAEQSTSDDSIRAKENALVLVNFTAYNRLDNPNKIDCDTVLHAIRCSDCSIKAKAALYTLVKEYQLKNKLNIWNDEGFAMQSRIVTDILGLRDAVASTRRLFLDHISFTCRLNTLIAQKINPVSDDLLLTLSHCLIKAYSEEAPDGVAFYKEWVKNVTVRGHVD